MKESSTYPAILNEGRQEGLESWREEARQTRLAEESASTDAAGFIDQDDQCLS